MGSGYRIIIFFFIVFFSVFICIRYSGAVGIQAQPVDERTMVFQPGLEKTFYFNLVNTDYIESYKVAPAELDAGVTINDPNQYGGPRQISATVKLPATLAPGKYQISIGGKQSSPGGGNVGGIAAVESRIFVISLHPGTYPIFNIITTDVGVNLTASFGVKVYNFGTDTMHDTQSFIDIYDGDTKLGTIESKPVDIVSNTEIILDNKLDTVALGLTKPGNYLAVARLDHDGREESNTSEGGFRVGILKVDIINWTQEIVANATVKFQVSIISDWATSIQDVYAKIYMPNNKVAKTPNLDIEKFQSATLETYIETDNLSLGKNSFDIEVFYNKMSIKKTVDVDVVDHLVTLKDTKNPANEKPLQISTPTIVIAIAVILIILNLIYFLRRRKQLDSPIKPPQPK